MPWIAVWLAVTAVGIAGVVASVNSVRFGRRVAHEAAALWERQAVAGAIDQARIDALPPPVRAYLTKALGDRTRAVTSVRFRHGGTFRTKLDGPWQPIRGEQYGAAEPPGFLWWGRLRAGPGAWIDARDRSVNGIGGMLVSLESTFTLADRSGPELDQGALLRLLSELVLMPTAFLDDRYVTWAPFGDEAARATFRLNGREVTGVFQFGPDCVPTGFFADRYLDTGSGRAELRKWSGDYADYRDVDGMLVPHRFIGYWEVDGQRVPYVDFRLERPEYDKTSPF